MKGRKQALVEAILTGAFRPDRQGGLLLGEPLPAELPVEGCEDARAAWRTLVEAQARGRESGAPDPWGFAGLVRELHGAFGVAATLSEVERFQVGFALLAGPWRGTGRGGRGCGPRRFTDEELERHWRTWARFDREWDESTWGYWRFEEGLDEQEAFAIAREARKSERVSRG
jgi:hypothetical protein